jgi:TetR/AcrR family transcriptional regulator, lmrAB and yxaGH operons repressor
VARFHQLLVTSKRPIVEYANFLASELESSGFQAGCPIATAVLEQGATDDAVAQIGDRAFDTWRLLIADELRRGGIEDADDLAVLCVAALEGALILSRAKRSTTPLIQVAQVLESHFGSRTE